MDTDTCVVSAEPLKHIFDVLQDFDFTSVWECCALPTSLALYGTGYEPQTGVFGIRASAAQLVRDWHAEFFAHEAHYQQFSSTDQQAMLQVLHRGSYTFFPLPAEFNYRQFTLPTSPSGPGGFGNFPFIVHQHGLTSLESAKSSVWSMSQAALPFKDVGTTR